MLRLFRFLNLAAIFSLAISFSSPPPVEASAPLAPGFYTGWVFFSARLNSEMNPQGMTGWVAEYWQAHGDLMIKVDDKGMGGVSIVLPVEITLSDYVTIHSSKGDCTASTGAVGQTNYVHLRNPGSPGLMGDSFETPVSLLPELGLSTITSQSFGSLTGCEKAADANGNAMWKAMKETTSQITALQFNVEGRSNISAGGSCTIPGWEKTTPVPGGQGVRTLETCRWHVFLVPPFTKQEGWK
jgi:hypothetical protein